MSKVDIIRKHIGSDDFYDLNGTEMLSKILAAMDEYAQDQVKLFAIPDVIKSVCPKCGSPIKNIEQKGEHCYCHKCEHEWNWG